MAYGQRLDNCARIGGACASPQQKHIAHGRAAGQAQAIKKWKEERRDAMEMMEKRIKITACSLCALVLCLCWVYALPSHYIAE